jgi:hypothetical protein
MEEETVMENATGMQDSMETIAAGDPDSSEGRRGPTWRGWVLSILVAIILSVTATLLLGGSAAFRSDRTLAAGSSGSGSVAVAGRSCCPPADAGK